MNQGSAVRSSARANSVTVTAGLAAGYLQVNLITLPSRYADDFRNLCHRNPVPCPLLAESVKGSASKLTSYVSGLSGIDLAADIDIRTDAPQYMVYEHGKLVRSHTRDIVEEWTDDHVAFLIGCSFSFETALSNAGLPPRHVTTGANVPMYRTSLPLCPSGVFKQSSYVVSMRPYRLEDVEEVRRITRPFLRTHGEPIAWGWDAVQALGIQDVSTPEWGDAPSFAEEEVPVFWGCGVTPQEAVLRAELDGVVMSHAPGNMILLDVVCDSDASMKAV